jgi:hypothetical protein
MKARPKTPPPCEVQLRSLVRAQVQLGHEGEVPPVDTPAMRNIISLLIARPNGVWERGREMGGLRPLVRSQVQLGNEGRMESGHEGEVRFGGMPVRAGLAVPALGTSALP